MALTVLTQRPTSSTLGSVATLGGGAGSAHGATSDNNTNTYVQVAARAELDSEVCRLGFPDPSASIPSGAKVLSVGIRRTVQTVLEGPDEPDPPVCLHWFRVLVAAVLGLPLGATATPHRDPFQSTTPTADSVTWTTETLGDRRTAPDGESWDVTTNLAAFYYDIGRADDHASVLRVAEVYQDITYQQLSAVTVTGPSGTVADTRPTVTWTYSSPDSQPQQAYQVAVYTEAQTLAGGFVPFTTTPLQQSGWILGDALQWTLAEDLVDGDYVVYVQAKSRWAGSGDFVTDPASGAFTRAASTGGAVVPPDALLTSAVFDPTSNWVTLTMVPSTSSPVTVAFTVQASRDGGQSWQTRPSLTLIPADGMNPVVRHDRFFDIGITTQYRVLSYAEATPNAAEAFSNTLSVVTYGDDWWIRHPTNSLLDTRVTPTKDGLKITRPRVMGTFSVLSRNGRVNKKVVYGPTYGPEGTIELVFNLGEDSADYWDTFDQLDLSNMVLFVQQPDGTSAWWALGPGSSEQDTKLEVVPQPGNPGNYLQRKLTSGFTTTDPPAYF